jgi:hypothetical protein
MAFMLRFLASLGQSVTMDWRNVYCRDNTDMIALLATQFSRVSTLRRAGEGTMLFPPEYAWVELVIIGGIVVFISDLIGNLISFENRAVNALTTSVVFGVIFALTIYFRYGSVLVQGWGFAMMRPAP